MLFGFSEESSNPTIPSSVNAASSPPVFPRDCVSWTRRLSALLVLLPWKCQHLMANLFMENDWARAGIWGDEDVSQATGSSVKE